MTLPNGVGRVLLYASVSQKLGPGVAVFICSVIASSISISCTIAIRLFHLHSNWRVCSTVSVIVSRIWPKNSNAFRISGACWCHRAAMVYFGVCFLVLDRKKKKKKLVVRKEKAEAMDKK